MPLPNKKILSLSKLKAIVGNNLNLAKVVQFLRDRVVKSRTFLVKSYTPFSKVNDHTILHLKPLPDDKF